MGAVSASARSLPKWSAQPRATSHVRDNHEGPDGIGSQEVVSVFMTTTLQTIHDVPVLTCAPEGETIAREGDALDLIGNAGYQGAAWVVVPVERFDETFFQLSTRVAGDIIQKFVQYRVGLAVIGDISRHTTDSSALRDFVRECNRGRQTWFLADIDELRERLKG